MDGKSLDIKQTQLEKLRELFPEAISEGKVDWEKLKATLGEDITFSNDHFIYPDRFSESKEDYLKRVGEKDEEGYLTREGMYRKNSQDSGHYHSNWLNMMYPRLFFARNLLKDDGVIFISIDDNEVHNLRLLMNEIFGEENFVAIFPWRKRTAKSDVPFGISQDYEWILCFCKHVFQGGLTIERKYYKTDDYPNDRWRLSDLTTQRNADERPNSAFEMVDPKTDKTYLFNPKRVWGVSRDTFTEYYKKGKIVFPDDYDFLNITIPAYRVFESEDKEKALQKYGSGTIAHATLEINKEDGGDRKFICVQLPEEIDENSEAIVKEIISLKSSEAKFTNTTEKTNKTVSKPGKCIALDKLFAGNDQLKTNTVLQMRDAGVEFKTI